VAGESLYCTFFLDGQCFGVEVRRVQEVVRRQPTTPVPLAPAAVRGLINLRGQIVTAIDLRRRLGLPDRPDDAESVNVVIRTGAGAVSLLADDVGDVLPVPDDAFEPPPEGLRGPARELIRGVYKLDGLLLRALDLDRVLDALTPAAAPD
jgi:purine-binding chemotaxis protein CheW